MCVVSYILAWRRGSSGQRPWEENKGTKIVPEIWCIGMILPLYKYRGNMNNPDSYRGIKYLICIEKLFTAVLGPSDAYMRR